MKTLLALLACSLTLCVQAQFDDGSALLAWQRSQAGGGSTLNSGLVSYWKMDEASGNRADSIGSNTLTDNGSVGSGTGKINNAASFTTSLTKFLSHASSSDFQITGDWTLCFWVNITAIGSVQRIVTKDDFTHRDYEIYIDSGGGLNFLVFDSDGTDNVSLHADAISSGSWHCLIATYTAADKKLRLYVDGGVENVSSALPNGPNNSTGDFNISSSLDSPFGGLVDELGIWHKVFSSSERTEIYNSSSGKTTPF